MAFSRLAGTIWNINSAKKSLPRAAKPTTTNFYPTEHYSTDTMKGTGHFKDVIQNYLETRASYDELFAESFRKENKNIDECITHILTEVQRMGCAGLSDEEVNWAFSTHSEVRTGRITVQEERTE